MDLNELLSYKPAKSAGEKRALEGGERGPAPKALRTEASTGLAPHTKQNHSTSASSLDALSDEEKLKLLMSMDDDDDDDDEEVIDAGAIKRMLLSFEKKVLKNQEMRVKFPDMPDKFMESELELNDEVQKLHVMATTPEYYPILVETSTIQTILGLLSHDNSDISIAIIDLLQELSDEEAMTDSEEELEGLVDALLTEGVVALLVQNLERLDEKVREDYDGVHNILAIVENMCEVRSKEVCAAGGEQGLLAWLLKRVRVRAYDNNKLYAAEILAILLQENTPNQKVLGEKGGIDILLQSLAYYKRRDPSSTDEMEMVENLFDALCSALMFVPNRDRFLRGEGLQLMILMLKEKKMSRKSSLKVLNHAMINKEGADNCVKFIEVYGLRCLFPAFMKAPKKVIKAGGSEMEHEEHVCSIIVSLFKNVQGAQRERLVAKFVENDHEKVERLIELHFKYQRRLREADKLGKAEEEDEAERYLRQLDSGLYTLQMVDYIIAELCTSSASSIAARIGILLNQHGETLKSVKQTLYEYAENLGDSNSNADGQAAGTSAGAKSSNGKTDGSEAETSERTRLLELADKL